MALATTPQSAPLRALRRRGTPCADWVARHAPKYRKFSLESCDGFCIHSFDPKLCLIPPLNRPTQDPGDALRVSLSGMSLTENSAASDGGALLVSAADGACPPCPFTDRVFSLRLTLLPACRHATHFPSLFPAPRRFCLCPAPRIVPRLLACRSKRCRRCGRRIVRARLRVRPGAFWHVRRIILESRKSAFRLCEL